MDSLPPPSSGPAPPAVWLETFGCQMNVLDSELVCGMLVERGYCLAQNPDEAQVVLLNTCSVRQLSEAKVWSRLGRLGQAKQERPELLVGVLGCMAERQSAAIAQRMPHVDVICSPSRLDALPDLLQQARRRRAPQIAVLGGRHRRHLEEDGDSIHALDRSRSMARYAYARRAYVRITRGCNKMCSFCVVPSTRGAEVHRPPQDILDEVRRLTDHGVLEVTLIGQTVNHYAFRDGRGTTSFADLLQRVHDGAPDLVRLRFLTSYPRDFGDDALQVMAGCRRICRALHVPAQSGSDRVLRAMNRGYTRAGYLQLLARARALMPDISLSGDMIAGFCGETLADHEASLSLLREARYKSCFVFTYSPRSGTQAARRLPDDVPDADKKARHQALLQVQAQASAAHHRARIGHTLEVLIDGPSQLRPERARDGGPVLVRRRDARGWVPMLGRSRGDEIVALLAPAHAAGQLVQARIDAATNLSLRGTLVCGAGVAAESLGEAPAQCAVS